MYECWRLRPGDCIKGILKEMYCNWRLRFVDFINRILKTMYSYWRLRCLHTSDVRVRWQRSGKTALQRCSQPAQPGQPAWLASQPSQPRETAKAPAHCKKPGRIFISQGKCQTGNVFWLKVEKCLLLHTMLDTYTPMENSPPTTRVKEGKEAKERTGLRPSLFSSRL